jgi:hypothetical protein
MPELIHTLQGHDLGFLKMVAGLWGLELTAHDVRSAIPQLIQAMLNRPLLEEIVTSLPEGAHRALLDLLAHQGRMPWSVFSRKYGEVRSLGIARRDRERPDLNPISPAEMLWYRALIGKAFLNQPPEPQEFAYIPDDLASLLALPVEPLPPVLGQAASPQDYEHITPATDRILDDACTLLAGLRMDMDESRLAGHLSLPLRDLRTLLEAANFVDEQGQPRPEQIRAFLEAGRPQALLQLATAWLNSTTFNDLRLLPGLIFEGEWRNDPLQTRNRVLNLLRQLPAEVWWDLNAFIAAVKQEQPNFQRPAGDYDSWFIRRMSDNQYLRGFECWDEVDGALLRYLITAPLHWLGIMDLASRDSSSPPLAFRFSKWAADLLSGKPPFSADSEDGVIRISSEGILQIERSAPRSLRYQLARFCEWLPPRDEVYVYQITAHSLALARQQGLRSVHLIHLLRKNAQPPLPPALLQAIERWEQSGVQIRIQQAMLLRVENPAILAALRKSRVSRHILEEISPSVVVIRRSAKHAILAELTRLGYLGADETEGV